MGNLMIPVCCVCSRCASQWNSVEWQQAGGRQDFCPEHTKGLRLKEYSVFLTKRQSKRDTKIIEAAMKEEK